MATAEYTYPVVEIRIADKIEKDAFDFTADLSLDFSADNSKWKLTNTDGTTLFRYKRFDQIEIWAGYDKPDVRIFKGMITKITPTSNQTGNYVSYEAQNMGALIMFYTAKKQVDYTERNIRALIERVLQWNDIPFNQANTLLTSKIDPNIAIHLTLKPQSGDTVASIIQQIKEKTAYEVWIDADGAIRCEPLSVLQNQSITALKLEYGLNLISMEVGDIGQRYNRVEVYGLHPDTTYAFAEDKVLIAQMMNQVRTYVVRDRSIDNYQSCLKIAQEKLLQLVKDFKITATTIFLPTLKAGDAITLDNPYTGLSGTFIIQTVTHTIQGSNAETKLELFGGIVARLPESAVVNKILAVTTVDRRE